MEEEKIRLFVGGLASEVSAGDLQERFAPLGNVQKITLPPAKAGGPGHRGFAYVDFVPATDASLRKLFSAYNGCKWRGGFLRIEKAKEDYTDKLHREWAVEAASLIPDPPVNQVEVVQKPSLTSGWPTQDNGVNKGDTEASGLKIFFPRLRKLKSVPLTGLGKHKRSFQRVESSPLQLLLSCACEESLRSGSCNCSNINGDTSSLKQRTGSENDEISQAIEIERQRQLELLNRLFPSDSTSISLENQQVVELDDNEEKRILKHEGTVGSTEETLSKETLPPPSTERVKQEGPNHLLQRSETESIVGRGQYEHLNSKMDSENRENGVQDDSTSISVAKERAKQLELMHRLFPADTSSIREPEKELQPEVVKVKKKRKLDSSGKSSDLVETVMDAARGTITDHSIPLQRTFSETSTEQQLAEQQKVAKKQEQEMSLSKSIPAVRTDASFEGASEMILNLGDDSIPLAIAEDQERQALKSIPTVTTDALLEDESEMVLNMGDDSLPLAIAEEQEQHEVKNLSMRADELLQKASAMSRHLRDDSLSLAKAEVRERQTEESPQNVISEDGLEDSEMILNLGDESVPLSKAEEEERAMVRMFPTWGVDGAKHYDGTRTDSFSDPEESEEAEASGTEESSSEEQGYSEGSSDAEEADEALDSENEGLSSEEQDYSEISSDAGEGDEAEDSEDEEYLSEEEDDSLQNEEYLKPIAPTQRTESKLAEASLQRGKGESGVAGKQLEDASKWAALAEKCQFRTEGIMQSEESELERNSKPVTRSNKDADIRSTQVPGFQAVEDNTTSQQRTEAENNRGNPDNPSSSGQKLTRAAWKSLVGESGRVVFSLRQLTGSSLAPQTPSLTQEAQAVEDAYTPVEPIVSSKTSNQNQTKSKLAVSTAEKKHDGVRSSTEPKMNAAELANTPVTPLGSFSDVCPFMKSENAEKEWLATKSELRSDYRAKQKHAARNVKKLWGKR